MNLSKYCIHYVVMQQIFLNETSDTFTKGKCEVRFRKEKALWLGLEKNEMEAD